MNWMEATMEELTFGVELEVVSNTHPRDMARKVTEGCGVRMNFESYNHKTTTSWKIVVDASLNRRPYEYAYEIVSPVLKGSQSLDTLRKVMKVVAAHAAVNASCGFHVHVGNIPNDLDFFKRLFTIYNKFEPVLDNLQPASRRGDSNNYCKSLNTMKEWMCEVNRPDRFEHYDRYRKLNFHSFWRQGTVEFRQHSGTLNATKAIAWVRLCCSMVERAKVSLPNNFDTPQRRAGVYSPTRLEWPRAASRAAQWEQPTITSDRDVINELYRPGRFTSSNFNARAIDYIRNLIRCGTRNDSIIAITQEELNTFLGSTTWGSITSIAPLIGRPYRVTRQGRRRIFNFSIIPILPQREEIAALTQTPTVNVDFDSFAEFIKLPAMDAAFYADRISVLGGNNAVVE